MQECAPKTKRTPMPWAFVRQSPWHLFATFGGVGLLRPASGTFGTLAALIFYWAVNPFVSPVFWVCAIVVSFYLGAFACEITGQRFGVHDHTSMVIDEVFAIWMVLLTVPATFAWQVAAFVAFRFFDIVKIPPASWCDREVINGFGVMLDDLVAALQAIVVLWLVRVL